MDKIEQYFPNSQDILQILNLDPETGIFTYRIKTNRNIIVGQKAGTPDKDGYIKLHINHKQYMAHRLAFYCYHNYIPEKPLVVEHADGNPQNNSIHNLRVATQQQNLMNKKGKLGKRYKGVYYNKLCKKYYAQIKINHKSYHLGMFQTAEEAAKKYDEKAYSIYGEYAKLNFDN
jgi:hypothetical protein